MKTELKYVKPGTIVWYQKELYVMTNPIFDAAGGLYLTRLKTGAMHQYFGDTKVEISQVKILTKGMAHGLLHWKEYKL